VRKPIITYIPDTKLGSFQSISSFDNQNEAALDEFDDMQSMKSGISSIQKAKTTKYSSSKLVPFEEKW
jgi:hypothetical protein